MTKFLQILFRGCRRVWRLVYESFAVILTYVMLGGNGAKFSTFVARGLPYISVSPRGKCSIGRRLVMNSATYSNPIGRNARCILFVGHDAELEIGDDVGLSAAAIVAHRSIKIGNNVKLGGGVCVYDTDFHSLNSNARRSPTLDCGSTAPVVIDDDAFVGAHSIVLKGVTIGRGAVIGACSVVTKSVPPYEVWAGSPAIFLRRLEANHGDDPVS